MVTYYPILRHADAEMNAYKSLKSSTQKLITPIIEGKRISKNSKNTWDKTLNSSGKYLKERIGSQLFIYDFRNMFDNLQNYTTEIKKDNINPVEFIINKFNQFNLNFIPCINHDSPDWLIKSITTSSSKTVAIRIRYYDLQTTLHDLVNSHVEAIINKHFANSKVSLILDFREKLEDSNLSSNIRYFSDKNLDKLILSTTTLDTKKDVDKMSFKKVSNRQEISLYNTLKQGFPNILFSDYTTRLTPEPDLKTGFNMNNSYLKIYYTTNKGYYLGKSNKFDEGEPENFQKLCNIITNSSLYSGETYSEGDRLIKRCSLKFEEVLSHKKTIEMSINHHLEFTVNQL